jgi:LysR family transcriptional regulator, mexEF-oprN operon transcriptional activator
LINNIDMTDIDYAAFRRLDLNLLVAFDALLAEASVSRAAARLCIGQPAMSHALARLRELFGDDILFREGAAMRATPRALALAGPIRQVLDDVLQVARDARPFDPAEAEGRVRIALNDPLEALLLPGLVARLRARAPRLTLSVLPVPASRQLEQLDAGMVSLLVGHFPQVREVHSQLPLYESGFSCVFNPALIEVPVRPDLAALARLPHIHTTYAGEPPGVVDRVFKAHGLTRLVVARSAMPLSIPFVLKRSPLVAILPDMLARMFAAHTDLRFEPLPVEGLSLPISLVSHRRERSDPLIAFVARLLVESVEEWVAASGAVSVPNGRDCA